MEPPNGKMALGSGDRLPVPDPTPLTTAQLLQAIGALREILEAKINGHQAIFDARVVSVDTSVKLLQGLVDKLPGQMDAKLETLRILHAEKFASIQTQFSERDVRTEQTAKDSKVAVDAALQAAKEAVGEQNKSSALAIAKSEAATSKQIDQQALLINTATAALNDKIDDLKERLTSIESAKQAVHTGRDDSRSNLTVIVAIGVFMIAVIEILPLFKSSPQIIYSPTPTVAAPQTVPR